MKTASAVFLKVFVFIMLIFLSFQALSSQGDWYLKPKIGITYIDDTDAEGEASIDLEDKIPIEPDTGYVAGLGIGYFVSDNVSLELSYSYFDSDADVTFDEFDTLDDPKLDANFSVSVISLNAYWHVQFKGNMRPYLGIGIGTTTDTELDIENDNDSITLENDSDIAFSIMAGMDFRMSENLSLLAELKYTNLELTDLEQNSASVRLDTIDFTPVSAEIGLQYSF
ncbi:porin family protein [Thalassotalea sp. HSM 43]|uniref:porin family protein n=1 Tax=Thalassotalea sp. HSM 43 TaxID=2552945 RepID=UPI001080EF3E|nr:porin family protein [Thalassotalea sp. HSM 43]QBY05424.1 porin family protein [Thalassotalea sp. HSM 43]